MFYKYLHKLGLIKLIIQENYLLNLVILNQGFLSLSKAILESK